MTVVSDFALSADEGPDSMVAAERLNSIMRRLEPPARMDVRPPRTARLSSAAASAPAGRDNALSSADDLRLPRRVGNEWVPFNPADWQPYAPRQRWFRTPNDAFMTGNFHVSKSVMQKALPVNTLSWFQVLLASLYSGAFHPTAEGQAAMADAVVIEARRVLAKYQGRRAQR